MMTATPIATTRSIMRSGMTTRSVTRHGWLLSSLPFVPSVASRASLSLCNNVCSKTVDARSKRFYALERFNENRRHGRGRAASGFSTAAAAAASSSFSSFSILPSHADCDWVDASTLTYKYWTNNEFTMPTCTTTSTGATKWLPVSNPATGKTLAKAAEITNEEWQVVMERAVSAQNDWKRVPIQQRQRVMFRLQHLIQQHAAAIGGWITAENGKTFADAAGDVFRGLEVVESATQIASHAAMGQALAGIATHMDCTAVREPLGVCAGVCPFNFPAMIPLWMFPLAVTAGNSFVLKPSEKCPSASLYLAQLAAEAGLPPNVLQVVHGAVDTVQRICQDPAIQAISFVGGSMAGEAIVRLAAACATPKRVQANLAAKNHAVVMLDEYMSGSLDRAATVRALAGAAFGAAGQRCMALSTLILATNEKNKNESDAAVQLFLNDLTKAASRLRIGPGWQPGVDVGPLITPAAKARVLDIVDQALQQQDIELRLDGRHISYESLPAECEHGNFVGPTLLCNVTVDNPAYTNEIFGPVLTCLSPVQTLADAIDLINANQYGNGCALFTSSGPVARYFATNIHVGQVGINTPIPVPLPMFSFTGNKSSMRGDLNFYGAAGVQFYTQWKTIISHWPLPSRTMDLGGATMPTLGGNNKN